MDNDEHILLQCSCHSFEFLEFGWFDDDSKTFYVSITVHPKKLIEKLKAIWRILRGARYGISDEVLVESKEIRRLVKWLAKEKIGASSSG